MVFAGSARDNTPINIETLAAGSYVVQAAANGTTVFTLPFTQEGLRVVAGLAPWTGRIVRASDLFPIRDQDNTLDVDQGVCF